MRRSECEIYGSTGIAREILIAMAPYADSLAEDYSTHLAPLGYGRALYHPKSTMELHPGMLGFFDSYGEWTEILDLKDTASLQKRNLTLPSFELNSISTELRQWDEPRRSEGVSARTLHARAELEYVSTPVSHSLCVLIILNLNRAAGLPVTSGFGLEFTLCQDSGAVLITSKDVQRSRLKVFESSVTSWLQSNLTTILSGELALPFKQSGFCVILGTYAVETFALDTWRGKDKSISCGLGANIASAGSVAGGLQVYRGHTTGAWMSGTAEV